MQQTLYTSVMTYTEDPIIDRAADEPNEYEDYPGESDPFDTQERE